jgi:3-oxoacyl-[acyl-carrier-protein] synthase II
VPSTWAACCAGRSGVRRISRFDASAFRTQIAGEVHGFELPAFVPEREARKMSLFMHYVLAAAGEAVRNADLSLQGELADKTGVCLGVGIGGVGAIEDGARILMERGPNRQSPMFVPMSLSNMAVGHLSMLFNARGYTACIASACASSSHAIGEACRHIAMGEATVMLAGGAEAAVTELSIDGFSGMRALSIRNDEPTRASRPFDAGRDGFVLGEGAAVLVLEDMEHARKRGARIYCELAGYGCTSDAYHMTTPSVEGPARAMSMALQRAGCSPADVSHINAHATSTLAGDVNELRAIRVALGGSLEHVAISATKSMTGHLLGAAGAVEAVLTVLAIHHRLAPPTINLEQPDQECAGLNISTRCVEWPIGVALSNSFGFGGTNAVLAFKRTEFN